MVKVFFTKITSRGERTANFWVKFTEVTVL